LLLFALVLLLFALVLLLFALVEGAGICLFALELASSLLYFSYFFKWMQKKGKLLAYTMSKQFS
jgi:hypothetical protein